ncbi:MAG: phage holin family protein [Planctomycetota bacterium]
MSDARDAESPVWIQRLRAMAGELGRMVHLRRELAELELHHDYRNIRRLAVVGGLGLGFVLIGLSLLSSAAAHKLAAVTDVSAQGWMTGLGLVLILPGICILALGIKKFRADLRLFRGTVAELREDVAWLREWMQQADSRGDEES